ncbi:MAG: M20 family metallo-hydrolase [Alistipes sp.]|nr:M20 family metallo-hydrolase [Alistipes sp.]
MSELIRVPSFSREESETARILAQWLGDKSIMNLHRRGNNVWVSNLHFDPAKPTILLCSHHDTVRPSEAWTRDPFDPVIEDGRLYGLGSNDAGASVVSLSTAFRHFYDRNDLKYNLILALVAEEEISGPGGVRSILPELELGIGNNPSTPDSARNGDFAIVGEPTGMNLAIAERGLMVLDCTAKGRAGHAARDEGDNAIYRSLKDIEWFRDYRFPLKSPLFGEVKMSVTMISAGVGHNVVPAECRFVVDCRVTECYTNEDVLDTVRQYVACSVEPRSLHLRSSSIELDHPVVQAGIAVELNTFGSPTTSDQVTLTAIPSVKIGPGQSARSHSADEYVELAEIERGIELYIKLLEKIVL